MSTGANLGDLVSKLQIDTKEAHDNLRKIDDGLAKISNSLATSQSKAKSWSDGFSASLGKVYAAIQLGERAVKAISHSLAEAAEKGLEAVESYDRLHSALKQLGTEAIVAEKRNQEFAKSLSIVTNIMDSDIVMAMSRLALISRESGENLNSMTTIVIGLAEVLKTDVRTATEALNKALHGQFMYFQRHGIVVNEHTSRVEAFNNVLKLAADGFQAVSDRVDSQSGKIKALSMEYEKLQQNIGKQVINFIGSENIDYVTNLLRGIQNEQSGGIFTAFEGVREKLQHILTFGMLGNSGEGSILGNLARAGELEKENAARDVQLQKINDAKAARDIEKHQRYLDQKKEDAEREAREKIEKDKHDRQVEASGRELESRRDTMRKMREDNDILAAKLVDIGDKIENKKAIIDAKAAKDKGEANEKFRETDKTILNRLFLLNGNSREEIAERAALVQESFANERERKRTLKLIDENARRDKWLLDEEERRDKERRDKAARLSFMQQVVNSVENDNRSLASTAARSQALNSGNPRLIGRFTADSFASGTQSLEKETLRLAKKRTEHIERVKTVLDILLKNGIKISAIAEEI